MSNLYNIWYVQKIKTVHIRQQFSKNQGALRSNMWKLVISVIFSAFLYKYCIKQFIHTIIHSATTFLENFDKCVHPVNTFTVIFLTKIMARGNKNHLDYEVIKSFSKVGSAQKFNKIRGLAFRTSKPIDACLKYKK